MPDSTPETHDGKPPRRAQGRRGRFRSRGRQVDAAALADIRGLLGDRPRRRDLLIEHLHLIQDRFGHLSAAHLAALAEEMRLSQTEVYEVATFYAHFDVVKETDTPPPELTVRVCDSLTCMMNGGTALHDALTAAIDPAKVRIARAPCMGRCDTAPVAEVGHFHVDHAAVESIQDAVSDARTAPVLPAYTDFDAYVSNSGYDLLRACLGGARDVEAVIATLSDSGLRGLGGAGFPAGRKWQVVRGHAGPRLMAVNADEGEPGTFKDRYCLETDPHRVLEGMLIAAWAVEAEEIYFYLRDEYPAIREILQAELPKVTAAIDGLPKIHLRRGAGAYICGEESAMLESIEGKRGEPRHKPPFPAEVGLFGRPTLIHNVETLYWLRDIIESGADWFSRQGRNGRTGVRAYSVSGRVRNPGVKIAPAGITANELIAEYCDGMLDGHGFKGYLPGGASGGILPASMADLPLDFDTLNEHGCFIGSAAIVVLSDKDNVRDVALNLMRFFEDESCGQCTPCRVGTEKAATLLMAPKWDEGLLRELSAAMMDASICGLGQAAPNPVLSAFKYFPEDAGA